MTKKAITTDVQVRRAKTGKHRIDKGLYLRVVDNSRLWQFRYQMDGRRHEMGIGSYPETGLAAAREAALDLRRLLRDGRDPLAERRAAKLAAAAVPTFAECADRYIKSHRLGWRNPKHAEQWRATVATYAQPVFGGIHLSSIVNGC